MLTDLFGCSNLNNNNQATPFHEEKNSTNLEDCQIFNVIKVLGYLNIGVY